MLVPLPRPQQKDTQGVEVCCFSIVFWKKLYYFEDYLWWNTLQNPPSIQWCSKLNAGDLLEDSDAEQFWNFIYGQKKIVFLFFALADENIYHPNGQKKIVCPFKNL